jgi:hypothetical protein
MQAAIWCAAGIKKKMRARWTTELPCPIILVKEDTWLLYIGVYQDEDTLVSFLRDKIGVLLIKGSISPELGKSDLHYARRASSNFLLVSLRSLNGRWEFSDHGLSGIY